MIKKSRVILAAEDDFDDGFGDDFGSEGEGLDAGFDDTIDDSIDEMADAIEDLEDTVDEIQEDDVNIEIENNINDHYIAECDKCHGIFISAVIESDQEVETIKGICPLCGKESEQYLNWVIKKVDL